MTKPECYNHTHGPWVCWAERYFLNPCTIRP